MTIRAYFQMILDAQDWDACYEAETEAWEAYEADDGAWEAWLAEHPQVDIDAMEDAELSVTLWVWDMCGE